jgi:hypothetical protein
MEKSLFNRAERSLDSFCEDNSLSTKQALDLLVVPSSYFRYFKPVATKIHTNRVVAYSMLAIGEALRLGTYLAASGIAYSAIKNIN